jgi:hypothetical protein
MVGKAGKFIKSVITPHSINMGSSEHMLFSVLISTTSIQVS